MTLLLIDGFDHYGTDTARMTEGIYDTVDSDFAISSSNPRTGNRNIRRNNTASNSYITKSLPGDRQGLGTGAAFYLSSLPTNENSYPVFDFMYDSTTQLSCAIQPDGSIDIKIGGINGPIVASSDTGLVKAGEFFHLEFAAYPDSVEETFSAFLIQRKEQWKNIIENELSTNDYSDPSFDDSSWSTDPAPFWEQGENPILLPLGWDISGGTSIPEDSLVWMRRSFFLPASATIDFVIAVDDFYNFYIDGVLVSETESDPSVGVFEFSVSLPAGTHVIAAQIVDLPDPATGPSNFFYADMETDNVVYGQIDNGGIVEVRLNGVTVISNSDVITTNSTTKAYNKVRLACGSSNSHGITTDIDDWYIWDDQGSWNNSFIGDRRCFLLKPNQDTNIADFDPSSGDFGYKMIDDSSPDDDSSYIIAEAYLQSGSPLTGTSEFEIEDLSNGTSLISAVNVITRASKTDETSAELYTSINSGADSLSQSPHILTTSYQYYDDIYEYDPETISSLTRDSFNSLSVSITADDLDPGAIATSPTDSDEPFSPSQLFSLGEDGAWYDPSDLSTLWQDTGATTPVTGAGQSVARIDDKSGNGRHLIQATSTNRPTYQTSGGLHWLDFDGGDFLQLETAAANITEGGGTLAAAASSDNAEGIGGIIQEVDLITGTGEHRNIVFFDTRATPRRLAGYIPDNTNRFVDLDTEINGAEKVFIFSSDGSTGEGYLDNVQQGSSVTTTANFANNTKITLGRQTAGPAALDGKIYGAVILDRGLTTQERSDLNIYLSTKAGI